jgi:two-component system response regulator VicR
MSKKLLVVEDDKNISYIITENAKAEGYECDAAFDGEDGLDKALNNQYDLIILDLMLPKMDGFEICRNIRQTGITTPVIIVTAREEEVDKILGLELGADDYITKPFSVKEMFARIKANIRRSSAETIAAAERNENIIKIGSIVIDNEKYKVEKNGSVIELSKLEYDLLSFFAKNPGKIFSRAELLKNVWKDDFFGERTVDTTVNRLRGKIEDDVSSPKLIQNKRGVGYYLSAE